MVQLDLSCGHQRPQPPRPLGSAEPPQRLGLDLPDPLARDIKLLADFFEGVFALAADTEAQPEDLLFVFPSWVSRTVPAETAFIIQKLPSGK